MAASLVTKNPRFQDEVEGSQFPDEQDPDDEPPAFASEGEDDDDAGSGGEDGSSGDAAMVDAGPARPAVPGKRPRPGRATYDAEALKAELDEVFHGIPLKARISVCRGYQAYLSGVVRAAAAHCDEEEDIVPERKPKRAYFKSGAYAKRK